MKTLAPLVVLLTACSVFPVGLEEQKPDGSDIPWSRLEGRIAFTQVSRHDAEGSTEGMALYEMDVSARQLRKVKEWRGTLTSIEGVDWSPDGSRLAFDLGDKNTNSRIFRIDRDGKNETALYGNAESYLSLPAWSSDGRLAYLSYDWDLGIHEILVDGDPISNAVAASVWDGTRMTWSPNGQSLLVVTTLGDSPYHRSLHQISVSDGSATLLREGSGPVQEFNGDPIFSPAGESIAFTYGTTDGGSQIWVMDADGQNPRQITTGPSSSRLPVWSPDGTQILFTSDSGVYLVNSDGSDVTLLIPQRVTSLSWTD